MPSILIMLSFAVVGTRHPKFFALFNGDVLPGITQVRGNFILEPSSAIMSFWSIVYVGNLTPCCNEQGMAYGWMGFHVLVVLKDEATIKKVLSCPRETVTRTGGQLLMAPLSTLQTIIGDTVVSYIG